MAENTKVEKAEISASEEQKNNRNTISETWAQETIEDMDDFIESQGIYLRQ